jgi:predicted ABC-type ATPase
MHGKDNTMQYTPINIVHVIAGANGSGKTTLAKTLLPREGVQEFVNADEIARGLSPFNADAQKMQAGRLFLSRIKSLVGQKKDFAIETTLSGQTILNFLKYLRANDKYAIFLHYIYTSDPTINTTRIKRRVSQGGHYIEDQDVQRRYRRGLFKLFENYRDICTVLNIYDSSSDKILDVASWYIGEEKDFIFIKRPDILEEMRKKAYG